MLTIIYWFSWQLVGIVQPPITNRRSFITPQQQLCAWPLMWLLLVLLHGVERKPDLGFKLTEGMLYKFVCSVFSRCHKFKLSNLYIYITLAPSFFRKMSLFCWQYVNKSQKVRCFELFYWLILELLWMDNVLCPQNVKVLSWRYFTESLISVNSCQYSMTYLTLSR